jgi:hypothetical protein
MNLVADVSSPVEVESSRRAWGAVVVDSAEQDARLYGRPEARRYRFRRLA